MYKFFFYCLSIIYACSLITGCRDIPHIDPDPPDQDVQAQLFSALEKDDKDELNKVLALIDTDTSILEATYKTSSGKLTPLHYALSTGRYEAAYQLLSRFAIDKLKPIHIVGTKNAIDLLLELPANKHKKLYEWFHNLLDGITNNKIDPRIINYFRSDRHTRKRLSTKKPAKPKSFIPPKPQTVEHEKPKVEEVPPAGAVLVPQNDPKVKPIGIGNSGNSCYANATMQLLMLLEDEYWLKAKEKYMDDPKATHTIRDFNENKQKFLGYVYEFRDSWFSGYANNTMTRQRLRTIIDFGIDNGIYSFLDEKQQPEYYKQQDAHQFLAGMTGMLGDTEYPQFKEEKYIKYIHPTKGKQTSIKTESLESGLSLPISDFKNDSPLEDVVAAYFKKTALSGDTQYEYKKGKKVDAIQYSKLKDYPKYFFIQLKRFSYDTKEKKPLKLVTAISIPDNNEIDMTDYLIKPRPQKAFLYEIIGMAIHHGSSADGGHYTAYVKYPNDWFHANDGSISKTTWEDAKKAGQDAYLFLLRRIEIKN